MRRAIDETYRRRQIQTDYNEANGITPQSIVKPIDMSLVRMAESDYVTVPLEPEDETEQMTAEQRARLPANSKSACARRPGSSRFEKAARSTAIESRHYKTSQDI